MSSAKKDDGSALDASGRDNVGLFGAYAVRDLARHTVAALHVVLPGVRGLNPLSSTTRGRKIGSWSTGLRPHQPSH